MQALHARYPFRSAAKEAVRRADADLGDIVGERAVVERALDRVQGAVEDLSVGEPHRSPRVELLSYPVARVLVSLVGETALVERYARAEAETALDRIDQDAEDRDLRSVGRERLDLGDLLREFDLADAARGGGDYRVDVPRYLDLSTDLDGEGWRLVNRPLSDGAVTVSEAELRALVREAIRRRVAADLPLDVPDSVAAALDADVGAVSDLLSAAEFGRDFDRVVPDLFPPCIDGLLDRVEAGEDLPPHSTFSLVAFLSTVGMGPDEVADRLAAGGGDEAAVRRHLAHVRADGGTTVYAPPSCATMAAYGDCPEAGKPDDEMDEVCREITHPLAYYEKRLD